MGILTDLGAFASTPAAGDFFHIVDISDTSQDAAGSSFKATRNQILTQSFSNLAARNAAVPGFIGQFGVQTDIGAVFQSTGTSAGNWIDATPTTKTLYVDKTKGHTIAQGATGAKSNPFSTLAEARTTAVALTPSATNRPLIRVDGYFNEGIVLANFVDWDLGNSILDLQAGALATIDDNDVACDSIIYGNATIIRSTAGTSAYGVKTKNTGTVLTIYAKSISSSISFGAWSEDGSQKIYSTINAVGKAALCSLGTQTVNGDVSSTGDLGAYITGGVQTINGNVSSTGNDGASCNGGNQIITGNCSSTIRYGAYTTGGTMTVNGNCSSTANYGAFTSGGTMTVNGNCSSTANNGSRCETGTMTINGNSETTATGAYNGAACVSGTMKIKGNCVSKDDFGAKQTGGQMWLSGRIVTTGVNMSAISKLTGVLIVDSCTLIGTGAGYSIVSAGAEDVIFYGTSQGNKDLHANIAGKVGVFIFDTLTI